MQHFHNPRTGVVERIEHALARFLAEGAQTKFAVFVIGLDRCSALSETLGYSLGEQVLNLGGQRLASALRERDELIRLSTDEFVVLLNPLQDVEGGSVVARRLVDLLQRPYLVEGRVFNISASVGITLGPENGSRAEVLLDRASIALRSARAEGAGAYHFFDVALEERVKARYTLAADLRKALPLRQFEVHYQPQVNMRSRDLVGFEALLRWHHPLLGMVSPGDFIPLAEDSGLIAAIGGWVLRTACRQAARLPNEIVIAVNASPIQLRDGTFLDSVQHALSSAGLPASRLEIEITEGTLLQHTATVLATLHGLHSIGVRLAIDDFGTGYSSLGQLAKLPFDTIKIDRSLVGASIQQRAIVRSIVALGSGLGMSILAEGLETEEEFGYAASAGCSTAQGYLFGKAAPASHLDEFVARSRSSLPAQNHSEILSVQAAQKGVRVPIIHTLPGVAGGIPNG